MSAESHKIRELLDMSLSDLEDSLGTTGDDVALLNDLQQRIGGLLRSDRAAEREIRALLQERYDDGDLRSETYQLVKSMLDRNTTEQLKTDRSGNFRGPQDVDLLGELDLDTAQLADHGYSSTAVIEEVPEPPATADEQVQVGSVLRDRFLLQERVSGGSMGVVYRALDRRLAEAGAAEPWVAIKILSPQLSKNGTALRALQQEAAKGRCLSHSNIVRFIDLDREDELYFIVMEWLEGRTLAEILDSTEGKAMGTQQAIGIVHQLANALGYAHRCGIIHADVKPANVMILPSGDAKLFDFGVARVRQTQDKVRDEFNPGVLGALTPAYSSMQVLTGEEPVPADDVFSLGCLFYRLVAGYRVFGPRNAAEAAEEGMKPQRPQGLTDGQWRALRKAISFSRVTRYQSMSAFIQALEERSAPEPEIETRVDFDVDDHGGSRSWLVGLVALLALLGFAVYQFGFSDRFAWSGPVRDWIDEQVEAIRAMATEDVPAGPDADAAVVELPEDDGPPIAEYDAEQGAVDSGSPTAGAADTGDAGTGAAIPTGAEADTGADAGPAEESLPPADVEVALVETTGEPTPVTVALREDRGPTTVDLRRSGSLDLPLRLRLEEVGYSGNRSPWAASQYTISDDGAVEIPAGADRARLTLEMASDPLREADQVSILRVRSADSTTTQYATLEVELQDDDQRAFEAQLPTNTVGFAVSQVAVRERDPVVQVDVLRFNPDDTQIVVNYSVSDITATEGEDYFSPGGYSVSFGPGQRSARLLIPLVQDSLREGDEAFTVELAAVEADAAPDVFRRIVVMIRDDD